MKIPHPSEMQMLAVAVTRYWELTHFYLLPESDTLSALVAPLAGNEPPANPMIFVPSCEKLQSRSPFSAALRKRDCEIDEGSSPVRVGSEWCDSVRD